MKFKENQLNSQEHIKNAVKFNEIGGNGMKIFRQSKKMQQNLMKFEENRWNSWENLRNSRTVIEIPRQSMQFIEKI